MNIEQYQELKGITLSEEQYPQYEAWLRRANALLWDKLGWKAETPDYINIAGATKTECPCEIDQEDLNEAPQLRGQARVYPVILKEPNLFVDPFTKVHDVYICKVEPEGRRIISDNNSVVILKKVEQWSPAYFSDTFGKYIKKCQGCCGCSMGCINGCRNCINILVDADWVNKDNMPDDLLYLIMDYMDWLEAGGATAAALNIRAESVTGHSVSYGDRGTGGSWNPYSDPSAENLLLKYAGPYGSIKRRFFS